MDQKSLDKELKNIMQVEGALICEVMIDPNEKMEPKLSSEVKPDGRIISKPLEDMFPFLPRDVFEKNMIIPMIQDNI